MEGSTGSKKEEEPKKGPKKRGFIIQGKAVQVAYVANPEEKTAEELGINMTAVVKLPKEKKEVTEPAAASAAVIEVQTQKLELKPKLKPKSESKVQQTSETVSYIPPTELSKQLTREEEALIKEEELFARETGLGVEEDVLEDLLIVGESPQEQQVTEDGILTILPPVDIKDKCDRITSEKTKDPYLLNSSSIYPQDRKGFIRAIASHYGNFALPPRLTTKINPNACNEMTLQTYKYQEFIREYMRQGNPYRGILVYHGLGSGKTCTAIAASEALFSQSDNKKIIIMAPSSLEQNFFNELMFCGLRHYNLKNFWVPIPINETSKLCATQALGIPEKLLTSIQLRSPNKRVFWLPDFTKEESESNFNTLEPWEQTAVREQINSILHTKFKFIGYNGILFNDLMNIAVNEPEYFDNSIIVIDEVHNLGRLITGKLEKYYRKPKPGRTNKYYEEFPVGDWTPKQETTYSRAFLFYLLLCKAKNSKIIALSGTPIVNQPTEIGILGNMLRGYFYSVQLNISKNDNETIKIINSMLENHRRVNFFSVKKKAHKTDVFFTILDDGYIKQFDEKNQLQGVIYIGVDDAVPNTINDLYLDILSQLKEENISIEGSPSYSAHPLFPPTVDEFEDNFVDKSDQQNPKIKNAITFMKRFSGLVSYYKGSKEELMPAIRSDVLVECPMSELAIKVYSEGRTLEINQTKPSSKGSYDEAVELDEGGEGARYRFRSRSACNFAFPTDIIRPFPGTLDQFKEDAPKVVSLLGDSGLDIGSDPEAVKKIEQEEAILKKEEETLDPAASASAASASAASASSTAVTSEPISKKEKKAEYERAKQAALDAIDKVKYSRFTLDPSNPPENQLKTYSGKYAAIIQTINQSPGSNLVYSSFEFLEGIGIFAKVLDANGFEPIVLKGPLNDLEFSESTVKSLLEPTETQKLRYISYTGKLDAIERQTMINIFNMRLDKLPQKIKSVLEQSPVRETRNLHGEICKVFMITAAGAEGLSLRNVRTVHIMEPYWNKVRTDQVKGRAVRICSHSDLPYNEDPTKNERVVDVFTYISVLPKDGSIPIDETLRIKDESKTTDEHIVELATVKDAVSSDFIKAMKSSAVDCILNRHENESGLSCFGEDTMGTIQDFLYDPRLENDIIETSSQYGTISSEQAPSGPSSMAQLATSSVKQEKVDVKILPGTTDEYHVIKDTASGRTFWYKPTDLLRETPVYEQVINPKTGKPALKKYK